MRIIKIISVSLLVLIAVVIAVAAFLLTTTSGLNFLVSQAKDSLPQLSQGTFNGSVLRLDAKDVVWKQPGASFKGDFGWHLDFNKIWYGEIVFDDF